MTGEKRVRNSRQDAYKRRAKEGHVARYRFNVADIFPSRPKVCKRSHSFPYRLADILGTGSYNTSDTSIQLISGLWKNPATSHSAQAADNVVRRASFRWRKDSLADWAHFRAFGEGDTVGCAILPFRLHVASLAFYNTYK